MDHFGEFLKPEACDQTVLPDRSVLVGQKSMENAKIQMSYQKRNEIQLDSLASLARLQCCNIYGIPCQNVRKWQGIYHLLK